MNGRVTWSARHYEDQTLVARIAKLGRRTGGALMASGAVRILGLFAAGLLVSAVVVGAAAATSWLAPGRSSGSTLRTTTTGSPEVAAECARRVERIELALAAHYSRAGDWPESLLDLVPGELPSLPTCPIDKSAYIYDRTTHEAICTHGHGR